MRILFYSYPQVLPQGPQFNSGWTSLLARLMAALARERRDEARLVTARRFQPAVAAVAKGLAAGYVDELELLRRVRAADPGVATPTDLSRVSRADDAAARPAVRELMAMVREAAAGFEPDLVVTFSMRAEWLKALWPDAEVFAIESGAFSRFPYPFTLLFDHLGMYAEAGPSRLDPGALAPSDASLRLAADLRAHARERFRRTDPFARYDFRSRFERLALFPLQVSNYYSFDEQSPYRTQFEYLVDVLAQAPPEVGVVVSEYVHWGEVLHDETSAANRDWLRRAFPNLLFHETFRKFASPSQYLLEHVDGAFAIASNLGYQALLAGGRLGCGGTSYLRNVAHDRDAASFFANLAAGAPAEDRLAFLAWYLERYLVPEALFDDGAWLSRYFAARQAAARERRPVADAFPPVADDATLRRLWLGGDASPPPDRYRTPTNRRVHALAVAELEAAAAAPVPDVARFAPPGPRRARDAFLLLNDTRRIDDGLHLGCNAVTGFLEAFLAHAGFACAGRANTGEECRPLLESPDLGRVGLVVLNGEGSLHHDSPRLLELLTFCREMRARGIPSVLVNSVWFENTDRLGKALDAFALVAVRESRSLAAIRRWRADARLVPDLSLAAYSLQGLLPAAAPPPPASRAAWTVIDHVDAALARTLHGFAEAHGFPFHLMGRLHVDALVREAGAPFEAAGRAWPRILRSVDELKHADAVLTGRFHGLTAALAAGVPFVALPSNTPKVEGLLEDAGIADRALLPREWASLGHYAQLDAANERLASQDAAFAEATGRYVAQSLDAIDALVGDLQAAARE